MNTSGIMKFKLLKEVFLFIITLNINSMSAQMYTTLTEQQQGIVTISALTTTGDLEHLKVELNTALDAGVTINEIKEIMVQLYAYCGFPRSLNALGTFQVVLEERASKGITDSLGKEIILEKDTTDKYEQGRKVLEALTGIPQAKPASGFGEFSPRIDAFLKEHLFADIFDSDVLTYQQREMVTIAALASMDGVAPQLQAHIGMGMNTGITKNQLTEIFDLIEKHIGKNQADIARAVLAKIK
ncbi:carboxymuconolactone decarboxylase family protein [Wandonia haliotis]|uniref:Carboxymuconolactone decarboxylase family protein n=2 Tax=Wandonia haliotis TaxID=574963 RepID=A0ABN1MRT2_9FLAO